MAERMNLDDDLAPGELVINVKTKETLKIWEVTPDGRYVCYTPDGVTEVGSFLRSELMTVEDYNNTDAVPLDEVL